MTYRPSIDEIVDQKIYFALAIFSVFTSISANMALNWIDYQTKVVAKCKPAESPEMIE